jgi:hypothetical protein
MPDTLPRSEPETPKGIFARLPRPKDPKQFETKPARFEVNQRREGETIAAFVQRSALTPEESAWGTSQPVVGQPCLTRLRTALTETGFEVLELTPSDDGDDLDFRLRVTERVAAPDSKALLRTWVRALRASGYEVGLDGVGIRDVDGDIVTGRSLTAPHEELYRRWEERITRIEKEDAEWVEQCHRLLQKTARERGVTELEVLLDNHWSLLPPRPAGFDERRQRCIRCGEATELDQQYDALFCRQCNRWTEAACSDPDCQFCSPRPARPMP